MNKKGFASITVIYGIVILLVLVMILILEILKNGYFNQREFINNINDELNTCLKDNKC